MSDFLVAKKILLKFTIVYKYLVNNTTSDVLDTKSSDFDKLFSPMDGRNNCELV